MFWIGSLTDWPWANESTNMSTICRNRTWKAWTGLTWLMIDSNDSTLWKFKLRKSEAVLNWDFKLSRRRVWCSELSSEIYCRVIPDDGDSTHLWNVGRQSFYTAVYPRRQLWTVLNCLSNYLLCRLGGLVVSMISIGPKVLGFKPSRGYGF
jgi:hypothetical protein